MSATIASPVTEPIANVRIVSGDLHSVNVGALRKLRQGAVGRGHAL